MKPFIFCNLLSIQLCHWQKDTSHRQGVWPKSAFSDTASFDSGFQAVGVVSGCFAATSQLWLLPRCELWCPHQDMPAPSQHPHHFSRGRLSVEHSPGAPPQRGGGGTLCSSKMILFLSKAEKPAQRCWVTWSGSSSPGTTQPPDHTSHPLHFPAQCPSSCPVGEVV